MSTITRLKEHTDGVYWRSTLVPTVVVAVVGVICVPLVLGSAYFGLTALNILIYAVMAVGFNVILGWPNVLVFSPSAFAILGGVTCALLVMQLGVPFLIALILGGVLASIAGVLIAFSAVTIGSTFEIVIITIAFERIVFYLLSNWSPVGPMGISGIPAPSIGPIVFTGQISQYLFLVAVLAVAVFVVATFDRSLLGTLSVASGENEELLRSIGYNPARYKMISIALGAFILGVGGALYAHVQALITPSSFELQTTILLMAIVVVGGMRRTLGPVVGAVTLVSIPEIARLFGIGQARSYIIGAALVLIVLYYPGGILGIVGDDRKGGEFQWRFWR